MLLITLVSVSTFMLWLLRQVVTSWLLGLPHLSRRWSSGPCNHHCVWIVSQQLLISLKLELPDRCCSHSLLMSLIGTCSPQAAQDPTWLCLSVYASHLISCYYMLNRVSAIWVLPAVVDTCVYWLVKRQVINQQFDGVVLLWGSFMILINLPFLSHLFVLPGDHRGPWGSSATRRGSRHGSSFRRLL